jgi:hypothetical protein
MSYTENFKKFVVVLNRRHPGPRLMNAACHAMAGLAATVGADEAEMLPYPSEAAGFCAQISRFPVIVLEARNSSQLASLSAAASQAGPAVIHNVFVASMIGASAAAQQEATRTARAEELDYMAVVLFGAAVDLDPMTKKFSLMRDATAPSEGAHHAVLT